MNARYYSSMMMLLWLTAACSSSVATGPSDTSSGGGGDASSASGSTSGTSDAVSTSTGTGSGAPTSTGTGNAQTTTSSASTGGGPPYDQACFLCADACSDPLYTCLNDPACNAWGDCATPCFQQNLGPSCWQTCDEQYPGAAALYGAVYQCLCQSCSSECGGSIDPCKQG